MTNRQNRNQNNSSNSHSVCSLTQCYVIWNVWNILLSTHERNNRFFTHTFKWTSYSISISVTQVATWGPSNRWVNNSWIENEMLFTVLWLRTSCPHMFLLKHASMHIYSHITKKWMDFTTPISRLLSVKRSHISGYDANEFFMNSYSMVFQLLWIKCCIMLHD